MTMYPCPPDGAGLLRVGLRRTRVGPRLELMFLVRHPPLPRIRTQKDLYKFQRIGDRIGATEESLGAQENRPETLPTS